MSDATMPLDKLPMEKTSQVVKLQAAGSDERRLLDLGIIEGTKIKALYRSPSGNPVAYRIRGAVIALRADLSEKILVSKI